MPHHPPREFSSPSPSPPPKAPRLSVAARPGLNKQSPQSPHSSLLIHLLLFSHPPPSTLTSSTPIHSYGYTPTMLSSISKLPFAQHPATWDSFWRDSKTPWDRGGPSLALHDLLAQRPDLVPSSQSPNTPRKRALVPGCGRGHDVLLLSSWGYDVWGLDSSAAARREAVENQKRAEEKGMYRPVGGLEKGDVHWVTGDFFGTEWTEGIGPDVRFDLIFDYTVRLFPFLLPFHAPHR